MDEGKTKDNLPRLLRDFELRVDKEFPKFFDLKRIITNSGYFNQMQKIGVRKIMHLFTGEESPKEDNAGVVANMTLDLFLHFRNYLEFNFNFSLESFHNKLWFPGEQ